MIKDNWIPVSDIIITQEINSIHCDTRDFCCSLSKDDIKKQYPDEELSKLFGLLFYCKDNNKLFLALAALKYSTDYKQYFTNGEDFILCDR